jgi:diguanylate cyclase (GGDEF)-like protein/PAS domain S-box-containing protein
MRADTYCIDLRIQSPASRSVIKAGFAHPAVASFQSGEDLFEALAAHTPVGIFISSAEGGCLYVNERWCELTGLSPEQALGDGWAAALHPDDAARVNREWAEAGAHGRDSVVEYRFLRPDGSIAWIEGYAAPLHDQEGRVIGWVGTCLDFTARKEADEAVARAGERFRVAFENAPIGMALLTPEGRWTQVNPALCELLGYSEEELLELTFVDVTHPDDRSSSIRRRNKQLKGHAPAKRIEKRYVRADDSVVWVAVSSTLVHSAAGEPLYTVAQIEDITARIRVQQELAAAEERFHRAFDDAPIGMALVTPEGRWLQVNPAFCDLLGYSADELTSRTFMDVTHPDDLEISIEHSRRQLEGEVDRLGIEKRFLRSDGTVVWAALTSTLARDGDGGPLHFVAQIEDVTERVRAQRALEEAEERFRNAFDYAPIGMALVDLDGHWLRVNPMLCEITGYTEAELLTRTSYDITHPDDLERNLVEVQRVIGGEKRAMRIEKRYVRPNGNTVWVRISTSLVRDADGKPLHFVSQIENVTDRKRAEKRLKELADHDSLTGLLNRRRFDEELRLTLLRLRRDGGQATLLLVDLDRFKSVNDTYGHKTGDDVLVAVAAALRDRLRETDVVARLGGDEFAAIALETGGEDARRVAADLAQALHALQITGGENELTVTASIGVVFLDQVSMADEDDALVAADRALYQAKSGGRDRIELGA